VRRNASATSSLAPGERPCSDCSTLNVGHAGVGSTSHLTSLLLNSTLGLNPVMINSGSAAMNGLSTYSPLMLASRITRP
jgi:hypothetical protein